MIKGESEWECIDLNDETESIEEEEDCQNPDLQLSIQSTPTKFSQTDQNSQSRNGIHRSKTTADLFQSNSGETDLKLKRTKSNVSNHSVISLTQSNTSPAIMSHSSPPTNSNTPTSIKISPRKNSSNTPTSPRNNSSNTPTSPRNNSSNTPIPRKNSSTTIPRKNSSNTPIQRKISTNLPILTNTSNSSPNTTNNNTPNNSLVNTPSSPRKNVYTPIIKLSHSLPSSRMPSINNTPLTRNDSDTPISLEWTRRNQDNTCRARSTPIIITPRKSSLGEDLLKLVFTTSEKTTKQDNPEENTENIIDTESQRERLVECTLREEFMIAEVLVSKGVDPNYLHPCGKTPLTIAVEKKDVNFVMLFLGSEKLDINHRDLTEQTPFIVASRIFSSESPREKNALHVIRKLLLEVPGIDLNAQDEGGNTALHYATARHDIELAEHIINYNGNINLPNYQGNTPLHSAAANNDVKIIKFFLKYDITPSYTLKNNENKTPANLAVNLQVKYTLSGLQTSMTHPLMVTFLKDLDIEGRLGMTMCPGRKQKIWARDIHKDVKRLKKEFKCDVLVSVVTRTELVDMGIPDLMECVKEKKIESHQFSISNNWVPNSLDNFVILACTVFERLLDGKCVIVHCDSGKGRTSLFVAALLILLGNTQEKATQILRSTDEGLLWNPAHIIYLRKFRTAILEQMAHFPGDSPNSKSLPENSSAVTEDDPEDDYIVSVTGVNDTTFSV